MIRLVAHLHDDQRGSMSIVSVFAVVLLVLLLGMVVNAARQVDHKVKLQNAADSSTYAGGLIVTRSMNTLAFTNHLLSDVFALTAFMREARDRNAEILTPPILDNWERLAPAFIGSEFPPFDQLGYALQEKVPRERDMVLAYGNWAHAASELMLPVLETILAEELIPEFQRSLTLATPALSQYAADEVARRHGRAWPRPVELHGVLWRTVVDPVGGLSEQQRRSLPVVDPVLDPTPNQDEYVRDAQTQRSTLAHRYLRDWNDESLYVFDVYGKMSQYSNLWRVFTCGQLEKLLNVEYPYSNLPSQIRTKTSQIANAHRHLEQDFTFVGVVYRNRLTDQIPRIFRNPIDSDTQAYAQILMFVPRRRLLLAGSSSQPTGGNVGGVPGDPIPLPSPTGGSNPGTPATPGPLVTVRQSAAYHPQRWDLINQNWSLQLAPASSASLAEILSTQPYVNNMPVYRLPNLRALDENDLQWLSHH